MTYKEILELIKIVNKSDLSEVKIKDESSEVVIRTKSFHSGKGIQANLPAQAAQSYVPAQTAPAVSAPAITGETITKSDTGAATGNSNYKEIRSPMVGTFYRSASPDKPPFIKPGDTITPGSVVCIIEAMKLFNEIESDVSGTIVKIMVDDASPVEFDQVLFLVE